MKTRLVMNMILNFIKVFAKISQEIDLFKENVTLEMFLNNILSLIDILIETYNVNRFKKLISENIL